VSKQIYHTTPSSTSNDKLIDTNHILTTNTLPPSQQQKRREKEEEEEGEEYDKKERKREMGNELNLMKKRTFLSRQTSKINELFSKNVNWQEEMKA